MKTSIMAMILLQETAMQGEVLNCCVLVWSFSRGTTPDDVYCYLFNAILKEKTLSMLSKL